MSNFYLELNTPEGRETFRREIKAEMAHDPDMAELQGDVTEALLEEVITKIRLEAFYINQLLPRIIDEQDARLRNDFLANSGLDRFQIEGGVEHAPARKPVELARAERQSIPLVGEREHLPASLRRGL